MFLSRATVTDEPDVEGRTAFMWAAGKGADNVTSVFIKHNVDIQQVDKNGGTGLQLQFYRDLIPISLSQFANY